MRALGGVSTISVKMSDFSMDSTAPSNRSSIGQLTAPVVIRPTRQSEYENQAQALPPPRSRAPSITTLKSPSQPRSI